MNPEDTMLEWIGDFNPEALLADGFNKAIIGMCERFGHSPVVAYDYSTCIAILMRRDAMTYEEAEEYFSFNVIGAYMGEGTPVFIHAYKHPPASSWLGL